MIQIDMEMPESCADCRFRVHCEVCEGYENFCSAMDTGDDLGHDYDDFLAQWYAEHGKKYVYTPYDHRHEKCPLIEVKTGHWENVRLIYCDESIAKCSVCGAVVPVGDYCSNCGSRNEAKNENN